MELNSLSVLVIVAVSAATEAVAFDSGGEALTVKLHALGVAAVAVLLLSGFVNLLSRIHYLFLNLNYILCQIGIPNNPTHH